MNPVYTFLLGFYIRYERPVTVLAGETFQPETETGLKIRESLSTIFWILLIVPSVFVSICVIRFIVKTVRKRREKGLIEEMKQEAERNIKNGEFVSAGAIYEKLKDFDKAVVFYEKGGDLVRAALLYETMGKMKKAGEMHEKAGDLGRAAEILAMTGDYMEAARIYNQLGDKAMAAKSLERAGNRLAAVRAYREAGDYVSAAMLLEEEGMHKEAADMYGISLAGEDATSSNIEKFYDYASLLEKAGESNKAVPIFEKILKAIPDYKDVRKKLDSMNADETARLQVAMAGEGQESTAPKDKPSEPSKGETALRGLIKFGGLEPKHILKLWVQILRVLAQKHKQGTFFGNLSPGIIFIDADNNVRLEETKVRDFAYIAPEIITGGNPDQRADIYSMGIILYEMIAGSLDSLGIKRPGEVHVSGHRGGLPVWLDELTMKCIEKEPDRRYQSLEEVFAELKSLKGKTGN